MKYDRSKQVPEILSVEADLFSLIYVINEIDGIITLVDFNHHDTIYQL